MSLQKQKQRKSNVNRWETKPAVDQRFITGLSAVYHRDRERSSLLSADQYTDAYLSPQTLFMQGMSGNEKGLQRKIDVGTVVNSQQRRALAVPVINRG